MLNERSQAHKYMLFDSICRKIKKRQINNGEKVSTVFTLGQGGHSDGEGMSGASGSWICSVS